jgi:hypothetical protein
MSIKHNFPHPCGSCTIALHIYEVKTHPRPEVKTIHCKKNGLFGCMHKKPELFPIIERAICCDQGLKAN